MCTNKPLVLNLVIMSALWAIVGFDYYMVNFYVKYLPGVIYYLNLIQCSAECLGYLASGFIVNKIGVKYLLVFSFGFASIFAVL